MLFLFHIPHCTYIKLKGLSQYVKLCFLWCPRNTRNCSSFYNVFGSFNFVIGMLFLPIFKEGLQIILIHSVHSLLIALSTDNDDNHQSYSPYQRQYMVSALQLTNNFFILWNKEFHSLLIPCNNLIMMLK